MSDVDLLIQDGDDDFLIVGDALAGELHAATHAIGGTDPLTPAMIGAATALALAEEVSARLAEDTALAGRIDASDAAIAAETVARDAAIAAEATARAAAIAAAVAAEAATRETADVALGGRADAADAAITAEATARDAAIAAAVAAEAATREAATEAGGDDLAAILDPIVAALPGLATTVDVDAAIAAEEAARLAAAALLRGEMEAAFALAARQEDLDREVSARQALDTQINERVDVLATDWVGKADTVDLDAEILERRNAELDLNNRLVVVETDLPTKVTQADIDLASAASEERDNVLWSNISDRALQSDVFSVVNELLDADGLIRDALNDKVNTSDVSAVGYAIMSAADQAAARAAIGVDSETIGAASSVDLSAETAARIAGDAGLTTALGGKVDTSDARLSNARTPTAHTHPSTDLSDATAVGKAVLTAVDAAAARTAIGATSSLPAGGADGDMLRKSTGVTAIWESITALAGRVMESLNGDVSLVSTGQATLRLFAAAGNASRLILATANAQSRGIIFRTGDGTSLSQDRGGLSASNEAETGANAGSNIVVYRCADDGTLLSTVLYIIRATGQVLFNGASFVFQTGDATISAGNLNLAAGTVYFTGVNQAIQFNIPGVGSYLDIRGGPSSTTAGLRVFQTGLRQRSTSQNMPLFIDDVTSGLFSSSATATLSSGLYGGGSAHLILSGLGGSTSVTISNPSNAPCGGTANNGRLTVTIENRGSGACATPTFGTLWQTRAWGAALGAGQIRTAEFRYISTTIGTARYFQVEDWNTFTP